MRIVHLTYSTISEVTGGLEYHIAYLTEGLIRRGHEVIIVNMAGVPGAASIGASLYTRFLEKPTRGATPASKIRRYIDVVSETFSMFLRRVLKSRDAAKVASYVEGLNPDVVHQHSYLDGLGASLLLGAKFPLVFTNHTGAYIHLDRFAPTRFFQRQLMKRFTRVIGPSHELLPKTDNGRYVPNGVDTEKFFPLSEEQRIRLKAKHSCAGKLVFICPRRWAPTKGIKYFADAMQLVNQTTREKCIFIFAGGETSGYARYQEDIRKSLAKSGCEVRTLGNLGHDELAEWMAVSDVCVIPSLMEATSLACLEAMACATPVLATKTGGLLELIRDQENGWLVPTRDSRALAFRLDKIVAITDLTPLREAAVATVRGHYTWKIVAERTEKIYLEALQRESAVPHCNDRSVNPLEIDLKSS